MSGVGCGHLLAPALADIDKIDGVARSFSNWTGTRLRVSVAPAADREAVAERVRQHLAKQQHQPGRVAGKELEWVLEGEAWRGADRIHELSSFEFRTYARQRVAVFAQRERLKKGKTDKLLGMVDDLWVKSGEGKGNPPGDGDGYAAYWNGRIAAFRKALIHRAAELLTPDQLERLAREGGAEGD